MELLQGFDLTVWEWFWIIISAFMVGFSKTGIGGIMLLVIPILAGVFGGKASTGVILPMLLIGDIFAVKYYHRHANWHDIKRLLPWTLIGLALGVLVGNFVNDSQFKMLIAISVLICLVILVYTEKKGEKIRIPQKTWIFILTGVACGFASMIGNAAGPILSIYLLAMGFKKNDFMGTNAWFFLLLNAMKMPLQIFFWHNINFKSSMLAVGLIPAIAVGALLGIFVIRRINERIFRYIIIGMTALVALKLFA